MGGLPGEAPAGAPDQHRAVDDRADSEEDGGDQQREIGPQQSKSSEHDLADSGCRGQNPLAHPAAPDSGEGTQTPDDQKDSENGREQLDASAEPDQHRDAAEDPHHAHDPVPQLRFAFGVREIHDPCGDRTDPDEHREQPQGGEGARDDEHAEEQHDDSDGEHGGSGRVLDQPQHASQSRPPHRVHGLVGHAGNPKSR